MPTAPTIKISHPAILDLVRPFLGEITNDQILEELRRAVVKLYKISGLAKPLNPALSMDDGDNRHRYEAAAPAGWEFNRVIRVASVSEDSAELLQAAADAAATATADNPPQVDAVVFPDKPITILTPNPNIENEVHITQPANLDNPYVVFWPQVLQATTGSWTALYYSIRPLHRPYSDPPQPLDVVSEVFFNEYREHIQAETLARLSEFLGKGIGKRNWADRADTLLWQMQKKVAGANADDLRQDESVDGRPYFAPRGGGFESGGGFAGSSRFRNVKIP